MSTMRAAVVVGPGELVVQEVPRPEPAPGEVLVAVQRVGLCGTDAELFAGTMAYVQSGRSTYPLRLGHEWTGSVAGVGPGVSEELVGRRIVGDPMIGDGTCKRCLRGRQHLCEKRSEMGLYGRAGALAEYAVLPVSAARVLPDAVDPLAGALVEPGGNALRAAKAAAVDEGQSVLIVGPGTIGLLVGLFARSWGADVHLLGLPGPAIDFARSIGFDQVWTDETLPPAEFDAVVDASNSPDVAARAVELVEPGGRVVLVGLAETPSILDSRSLALKDVTAVGVLSASPALEETIQLYASGAVDPRPLVSAVVGLDDVGSVLVGERPEGAGPGPKVLVSPV